MKPYGIAKKAHGIGRGKCGNHYHCSLCGEGRPVRVRSKSAARRANKVTVSP